MEQAMPVEDERHAILWCGLYRDLRKQLFESVQQLTETRDENNRLVMRREPVCMRQLLAKGDKQDEREQVALAIVMGGPNCTLPAAPRQSTAQKQLTSAIVRECKEYMGRMMLRRREWQHEHRTQLSQRKKGKSRDELQFPLLSPNAWRNEVETGRSFISRTRGHHRTHSVPASQRHATTRGRKGRKQWVHGAKRKSFDTHSPSQLPRFSGEMRG